MIALVTGASRGTGRAIALALADAGTRLIVHYGRGAIEAQAVVDEIIALGGDAQKVGVDLSRSTGPHDLAREVRAIVGDRLDILVCNAGIARAAVVEDTTVEDFDAQFAINVRAPYFLIQQLLPVLGERSSVVFMATTVAREAAPVLPAYYACRGALETLVMHFAASLGAGGIRVNAVAPRISGPRGPTGRDYTSGPPASSDRPTFADVGAAVAFMSSDAARLITGTVLRVDGGTDL